MQAFYASIDSLPDSIVLVIIFLATICIIGLQDERYRNRKARAIPPALNLEKPKPEEKKEEAA